MVGEESCGVFDDALFVGGVEAEFGQDVGVDDELGLYGVAVIVDADTVFVVDHGFDAEVFGHGIALHIDRWGYAPAPHTDTPGTPPTLPALGVDSLAAVTP